MFADITVFHIFPAVVYGGIIWGKKVFIAFCDENYEPVMALHYYTPGVIVMRIEGTLFLMIRLGESVWTRKLWSFQWFRKAVTQKDTEGGQNERRN